MSEIDPRLRVILEDSFYIRTTMIRRRSGGPRTVETTYYWNGADEVVLSGYPGRRDWVANINANPTVTLHTAEFEPWFDIPGRAGSLVLWDTNERLPYLLNFIGRWTERPGFPRRRFALVLGAIRINRKLRLPWWGPFWFIRKIFDQMPAGASWSRLPAIQRSVCRRRTGRRPCRSRTGTVPERVSKKVPLGRIGEVSA